jgi:hypothetical protein
MLECKAISTRFYAVNLDVKHLTSLLRPTYKMPHFQVDQGYQPTWQHVLQLDLKSGLSCVG